MTLTSSASVTGAARAPATAGTSSLELARPASSAGQPRRRRPEPRPCCTRSSPVPSQRQRPWGVADAPQVTGLEGLEYSLVGWVKETLTFQEKDERNE